MVDTRRGVGVSVYEDHIYEQENAIRPSLTSTDVTEFS